ncbi:MAG: hypothetical protein WCT29_02055 [Candidatus Paceibacterota bacterium]|jgi:Tfp pilus assembly protein PilO
MKFFIPTILIAIAVAVFFLFTSPTYDKLSLLRTEIKSYDEALGNSKALEDKRDKLTAKKNSFRTEDLSRLEKLLPENVDNIRLVLEIEQLAEPYNMALKNVKYDAAEGPTPPKGSKVATSNARQTREDYGALELEFTVVGTYDKFVNFVRDLENNLRIVDISSITFSSNNPTIVGKAVTPDLYEYNIRIKTYWLKN